MGLNLINDAWIPVHTVEGARRIRAWEIADAGVEWVDWGRGDLNLGCLELLVGLVLIADPPENETDWHARYKRPLSARLRERLEVLSPHFELDGPGPRFMQDLEPFEANGHRAARPANMLFIDSPGAKTRRNNADISVRRDRYGDLPLDLAAMALYTLQAWAPSGGAGNRTALRRGGGPLVTLVQPVAAGVHRLWRLVWANVPFGVPLEPTRCAQALPWLRATRTSEDGTTVTPDTCHPAQALFGMPRRLRLVVDAERVVGVIQKKHGTRYQGWVHPLTPHFRTNDATVLRPVPMRPGTLSYCNWLGVTLGRDTERVQRAATVRRMQDMAGAPACEILAGGWAMRGMKALDFHTDIYPSLRMDAQVEARIRTLVEAATIAATRLARALGTAHGSAADTAAVEEDFVQRTESTFIACAHAIAQASEAPIKQEWLETLRRAALRLFDRESLPRLSLHSGPRIERITAERRSLRLAFAANATIAKVLGIGEDEAETP